MNPTLADFQLFIRNIMGVPTSALPDTSPVITDAFNYALEIVLPVIQTVSPTLYNQAVYNLGGDYLLNWAPDQTGSSYFANLRKTMNLNSFTAGVIQASADSSTSESKLTPEFMKELTLANLQQLKTPYGRWYIQIAQAYGTNWGLT
jgi:hypothetical protein